MKISTTFKTLIGVISLAIFLYWIFSDLIPTKSEFDISDKENAKIINMFNAEIEKQLDDHTQSVTHPGYIVESRQNTLTYLKTIKTIQSYARYGVKSTQPRNLLQLQITFNDGSTVDKIYTGYSCSGFMDPCLLLKIEMKDGKAIKAFTNGQEKKGSPEWIIPDLNILIDKAIAYDIKQNHDKYFAPQKTQKDFEKEWESEK